MALIAAALAIFMLPASAGAASLVNLVNPFVGTDAGAADYGTGGGAGSTFPGATVPFGMVAFSPDTIPAVVNYSGGYTYPDQSIRGFSLTHFSGAGCALLADVPVIPMAGSLTSSPVVPGSSDLAPGIAPTFSHEHESARPGAYSVVLNPGTPKRIWSQLTATTRNGVGRFTYPKGTGTMMINAGGSTMPNFDADVKVDAARREISGSSQSGKFCYDPTKYTVYFAAKFDRPFSAHGTWTKGELQPGSNSAHDSSPNASGIRNAPGNPSTTAQAGAYVSFNTSKERSVDMKVGVSFVSVADARKNLVESKGVSMFEVRSRARRRWENALSSVRIKGGKPADRRTFASSLYHSFVEPSIANDVDGSYLGQDEKVHVAKGRNQYTDISGWDVYRSQIQLLSMVRPKVASDISQSLVAMANQGGCLPRWPNANQNSNVMTGDPSSPMIATTYALGARSFDAKTALKKMVRGASAPCHSENGDYTEREGLNEYLHLGWVPQDLDTGSSALHSLVHRDRPWGPAATSLEYALADFAISRLARSLGQKKTAAEFAKRADWWKNSVDPATKTIQPRFADGHFLADAGPTTEEGFVEGSAAQYSWMVPQNMAGLFNSMGGRKVALASLNHFFTDLNAGPSSDRAFLGNEPTLQTPWIYNWLGRPDLAASVARRGLLQLYSATPGGMPGNDDGGTMSAWAVLTSIGMSPVVPGTDVMPLGSPLFKRVQVKLKGGTLDIQAPDASRKNVYVKGLDLRGKKVKAPWVHLRKLMSGGRMNWDLAGEPSGWGRQASLAPPSFGTP